MQAAVGQAGLALALALALAIPATSGAAPGAASAQPSPAPAAQLEVDVPDTDAVIDPLRSRVVFAVRMRWFARVEGGFDRFQGVVAALEDGWRRVEVEVESASVEVGGRQRMTDWAASEEFFDVANYPVIVFVSDPFPPRLARDGGELLGDLSLRGTTARVAFDMQPATCGRPGRDCPIIVEGRVSRAEFGMDAHRVAVQDRVELSFEVMLADPDVRP